MSASEIDEYLKDVPARQRAVLERLRTAIMRLVPDAEECLSYRVPAFRVAGGIVGGIRFVQEPHELPALQRIGA